MTIQRLNTNLFCNGNVSFSGAIGECIDTTVWCNLAQGKYPVPSEIGLNAFSVILPEGLLCSTGVDVFHLRGQ